MDPTYGSILLCSEFIDLTDEEAKIIIKLFGRYNGFSGFYTKIMNR